MSKTTLNENSRVTIDGTESVRLATPGANWKATLSAIAPYINSLLAAVARSGSASDLTSGTLPRQRLPAPLTTALGGVRALAATAHQFLTGIGTDGVPTFAQPAAGDITGLASSATTDATLMTNVVFTGLGAAAAAADSDVMIVNQGAANKKQTFAAIKIWVQAFMASTTAAVVQAAPADPAGTTSTSAVHMGLGGVCKITPSFSTRVEIAFCGSMFNTSATGYEVVGLRYGTGTAPANGVAAAGTAVGTVVKGTSSGNGDTLPFSNGAIITGLTPGTPYWFDLTVLVNGGNGAVQSIGFRAKEI